MYSCGTFPSQPPTKGAPNRSFSNFVFPKYIRKKFRQTSALVKKIPTQLPWIHVNSPESSLKIESSLGGVHWKPLGQYRAHPYPQAHCFDYTLWAIVRSWCQKLKSIVHNYIYCFSIKTILYLYLLICNCFPYLLPTR